MSHEEVQKKNGDMKTYIPQSGSLNRVIEKRLKFMNSTVTATTGWVTLGKIVPFLHITVYSGRDMFREKSAVNACQHLELLPTTVHVKPAYFNDSLRGSH